MKQIAVGYPVGGKKEFALFSHEDILADKEVSPGKERWPGWNLNLKKTNSYHSVHCRRKACPTEL